MKKIILLTVVGGLLFAASAAGSWFFMRPVAPDESANANRMKTDSAKAKTSSGIGNADQEIPVAFKPPNGLSADVVIKLSKSIREREKSLNQREQILDQKQQRLSFVLDDLKRERREIEHLQNEIIEQIRQADELFQSIGSQQADTMDASGEDVPVQGETNENDQIPSPIEEQLNLRTVAQWLQSMAPEQSAEAFREFSNNGNIEMAVRLLSFFQERDAAKVLAALDDPILVTQLAERFRKLKRKSEEEEEENQ